jgi:hypothetical protein
LEKSSAIYELVPFFDSKGTLRMDSRLDAAPRVANNEMRHPIILGRNHIITSLIIDSVHKKMHHYGREVVLGQLRQKFWIPRIRAEINKVINMCFLCKFLKAKPMIPRMAALPMQRQASFQPAFTYTGLDYFGPIEVTVGRRREKRYGVLFSCLSTRAIHIQAPASWLLVISSTDEGPRKKFGPIMLHACMEPKRS